MELVEPAAQNVRDHDSAYSRGVHPLTGHVVPEMFAAGSSAIQESLCFERLYAVCQTDLKEVAKECLERGREGVRTK